MAQVNLQRCAAGGNRHPSAADWAPGLLAFGAGKNLALWNPNDPSSKGVYALLAGHSDTINAVKIYKTSTTRYVITGGADKIVKIWKQTEDLSSFECSQSLADHDGSINIIAILPSLGFFVSGAADGRVNVYQLNGEGHAQLSENIALKPQYIPLTCALVELGNGGSVLAVGGTTKSVQLYSRGEKIDNFKLQATLTGHESWIRSLDFTREGKGDESDILLASASQDKYIRIWRLKRSTTRSTTIGPTGVKAAMALTPSLSNKAHQITSSKGIYDVTFEALLIGHEDWIYTVRWMPSIPGPIKLTLLSASADNSLSLWEPDEVSKVWICKTRLGEISAQKGSTTATGSTGGFWIGLWNSNGQEVASLGRTGSWRRWAYEEENDSWAQQVGLSGHTKEVQSCAWAPDGSYLLTTGSDQTTRMLAEWKREGRSSWHEFARPQIHGYDLNCVASLDANKFVSGADEKLLRVFSKPKAIDNLLNKLSGPQLSSNGDLPNAANIPVLGLSNKTIESNGDLGEEGTNGIPSADEDGAPQMAVKDILDIAHPPLEDHLARHTLWPEHEKLYGHGYEISTVASAHDGAVIATACKASSLEHAVIRLYDYKEWREVKPPLTAHSLTVTSLAFSPDDHLLLSVSRDRGWFVFERDSSSEARYKVLCSNPKGHSRMILDCAWAPLEFGSVFATASRDKTVKVWKIDNGKVDVLQTFTANAAVTAVAFDDSVRDGIAKLAYGTEEGLFQIMEVASSGSELVSTTSVESPMAPSAAVNALSWRPGTSQLAVASDDTSLRIFEVTPK